MSNARPGGLEWDPEIKSWGDETETPYQHWWFEKESPERVTGQHYLKVFVPTVLSPEMGMVPPRATLTMPSEMVNPEMVSSGNAPESWTVEQVKAALQKVAPPDKSTVIVGIVDAGIALGHRRFRTRTGETRFLAAWQQSAMFGDQPFLPFGRELYANDINDLLRAHSGNDLLAALDEEAFNREAGLVTPELERGNRTLDYRAAHGTHVLDLAAGLDPTTISDEVLTRNRIIAVNLPPRSVHGSAGNFLAFFARSAVERILLLADAFWEVHYPGKGGGFPVVINFSFGQLAGPKDGRSRFELELQGLVRARNDRGAPTRFVMPAGNNNLSRGNARKLLGTGRSQLTVPWRIFPSDYTSNFVEIWTKLQNRENDESLMEISPKKMQLWVTPPGMEKLPVPKLGPGDFTNLSKYARIYCYRPYNQRRAHFVICIAPTVSNDPETPEAPAGLWEISLQYPRDDDDQDGNAERVEVVQLETTFTVQSDQSGLPHAVTGRQSYFDHECYKTHDEDGRLLDSYDPGEDRESSGHSREPYNRNGPVQRKGTQNALATWAGVMVIGGYRVTDGTPAPYSSTFDGNRKRWRGREAPSVLYPTDDGAAHFGVLAAGARDGSVVALRGTSMAAALATRDIAAELAKRGAADEDWLRGCADQFRERNPRLKRYNALKQGAGPVPRPELGRVSRLGEE